MNEMMLVAEVLIGILLGVFIVWTFVAWVVLIRYLRGSLI